MTWGNKETYIAGITSNHDQRCPVCNKEATMEYRLYQKSFTILGMSLFPGSKMVKSVCGNCGVTRQVKRSEGSSGIMDSGEVDDLLETPYSKLRFYSALFVLIGLASLIAYVVL